MNKSELQNLAMVDIHCHILPETDDGSVSLEESVEMCRLAAEDGITTIVATPHMFDGVHKTPDRETILRRIDAVMKATGHTIEIVPGGEVRYSHEIFDESRDPLSRIRLNGGSYMLLEFPFQMVPPNIENTIFQILNAGITPVIAHPERNKRLQKHPEILASLIDRGAFSQLDAGSLTGGFGAESLDSARKLLRGGMAHFIATDAHHAGRRRPNLTDAVLIAAEIVGLEAARMMVEANPRALIQDKGIPFQPEPDLDAMTGRSGKKWYQFWRQAGISR